MLYFGFLGLSDSDYSLSLMGETLLTMECPQVLIDGLGTTFIRFTGVIDPWWVP